MVEFFREIFNAGDFMPHGHCYFWDPTVLWLNVLSDACIAAAYYSIPFALYSFMRRRTDVEFRGIIGLFAAFIFWCGTTHVIDIVAVWTPVYRLEGAVKAVTAGVSVFTAVVLWPLIPRAVALPSPSQLALANAKLADEVAVRRRVAAEVRELNAELEARVEDRTAKLREMAELLSARNEKLSESELELQESQEQLRRSNADLQRRNVELAEFVHVASHDLREPLRKLVAFSGFLPGHLPGELPEAARKDLHYITDAATRMRTLIEDLLELSRVGRAELQLEPVDPTACLEEALGSLDVAVAESGGQVICAELPDRVRSDRTLLRQLFQNLIGNALKFTRTGQHPVVQVTCARRGDEWVFGVADDGIGIPEVYREQVFEPFQRLHGRARFDGSGVGLTICRKACERQGRRIWVEPSPSGGSHFQFTVEAVEASAASPADSPEGAEGPAAEGDERV